MNTPLFLSSQPSTLPYLVFAIVVLILLIAATLYVLRVRKRHMEEIRKRRRYFGLHEEEFNILKSMTVSMREIFKLNIVTALLVIFRAVCRLLNLFCVHGIHRIWFRVPGLLFLISNPFVYMCVMKELRSHYLRLVKCKRRQTELEQTTKKACGTCACERQAVAPCGGRESNVVRSEKESVQIGLRYICNNRVLVTFKQGSDNMVVEWDS